MKLTLQQKFALALQNRGYVLHGNGQLHSSQPKCGQAAKQDEKAPKAAKPAKKPLKAASDQCAG